MTSVTAPPAGKVPPEWTKNDVIDLVAGMAKIFPSRSDIAEFLIILTDDPAAVSAALEPLLEVERIRWQQEDAEQLEQDLHEVLNLAAKDPNRLHQVLFTLNKEADA